jgi:hypothetical protein
MRKIIALFLIVFGACFSAIAQEEKAAESMMTGNLKIYVVVAVLSIILAGIIIYLLSLEKRLKSLEEEEK